jgi:hypothetical protein
VMQIQWQSMFKNYRQRIRNTANSVA